MITGIPLAITYERITAFNKINENRLGNSLINLASGKRIRQPQDGISDFFRAQNFNRKSNEYSRIRSDIAGASAMMDVVVETGEIVYNGIERMKQLVDLYYDESTTDDEKRVMQAEFSSLVKQISHTINNTYYDGKLLVSDSSDSPLCSVNLDPDNIANKMVISFSAEQVANVEGLTLGNGYHEDSAAVKAELSKAGSYLASASAFSKGLSAQYAIADKKVSISNAVKDSITGSDSGKEVFKAMNYSIQQQSSFAMLAQANILWSSLVRLL
jgi:flagellin-like hook-associated protein FlgL